MSKKSRMLFGLVSCLFLTACTKEVDSTENVNRILEQEQYVDVQLGEEYHQSEVKFSIKEDKAVVSKDAEWGRPEYREKEEAGVYYGAEEGGEIFETDPEITPELYAESYFDSIESLNLTAAEVKKEAYIIQVTEKEALERFEKELRVLTGIIMKDHYELTGVEITFDKQCRPVQKSFQLQDIDEDELKKGEIDSGDYVQKFSYETVEGKFDRTLKKVKKEIEKE